jgi:endothelin-converting enzyme
MALACTTPACLSAASLYLSNLSPNYTALNPCTSFEEYACGGFRERTLLRPDESFASTSQNVRQDVQAIIRRILEGTYPGAPYDKSPSSAADRENFNLLQGAYAACMDEEAVGSEGVKPLLELLNEAADRLNASGYGDFYGWIAREMFQTPLLEFWVDPDDKDPSKHALKILLVQEIGLPGPEYYKDAGTVVEYEQAIAAVLTSIKPSKTGDWNATALAKEIVAFESRVAAVIPSSEELQEPGVGILSHIEKEEGLPNRNSTTK